jgi:hypothetical protein
LAQRSRESRRQIRPEASLASLAPLAFIVVYRLLVHPGAASFLLGFGAGASAAMYIGVIELGVPDRIQNWRIGGDAERRTARQLRPLQRKGWIVHNSVMADRGDRDHIALGPRGLFLLETKHRRGTISVADGALIIQAPDRHRPSEPEPLARLCNAR